VIFVLFFSKQESLNARQKRGGGFCAS